MTRHAVALLVLMLASPGAADTPEIGILREKRDAEKTKIHQQYLAALEKLQVKTTKAGDLGKALAVKAEIDRTEAAIKSGKVVGAASAEAQAEEPLELQVLREKRDREIVKIHQQYLAALEKLQAKFANAGNLEGALAVRAEIKNAKEKGDTSNHLIGRWKYKSGNGATHYLVYTEETYAIYRGSRFLGEYPYKLESPTKALVGKKGVHQLREDGRLDMDGKLVGERVEKETEE